jgi:hypothetical protein
MDEGTDGIRRETATCVSMNAHIFWLKCTRNMESMKQRIKKEGKGAL